MKLLIVIGLMSSQLSWLCAVRVHTFNGSDYNVLVLLCCGITTEGVIRNSLQRTSDIAKTLAKLCPSNKKMYQTELNQRLLTEKCAQRM